MGRKLGILSGVIVAAAAFGLHSATACEVKRAPRTDAEARKATRHDEAERWRIILPRNWSLSSAPSRRVILQ